MIGALFIYLVKATVCLLLFSVLFRLLMLKDTFVRFNRWVLLSGVIVSILLPTIKMQTTQPTLYQKPIALVEDFLDSQDVLTEKEFTKNQLQPIKNQDAGVPIAPQQSKAINIIIILLAIYLLGVVFMLARLGFSFYHLNKIIRQGKLHATVSDYQLVLSDKNITAFSFFNYIVLSEKDFKENPREIIAHENQHCKKRHSIDLLFMELMLVFHWFNVGLWSLRSDLREIHEYEADFGVINSGIDVHRYQILLIKKAVGERCFTSVVNSFNHSLIKNRITMMLKKRTNPWARLKVLIMLPLAVGVLYAFAQPAVEEQVEAVQKQVSEAVNQTIDTDNPLFLWNEVRNYCKANNIAMTDFYELAEKKNPLKLLINRKGAILFSIEYSSKAKKNKKNIGFGKDTKREDLIKALAEVIYSKYDGTPNFYLIRHDRATETNDVFLALDALVEAYKRSLNKIAKEDNISVETLRKEIPLLTYFDFPKNTPPPPPPPARKVTSPRDKNLDMAKQVSIHSVSNDKRINFIRKYNPGDFEQSVDDYFRRGNKDLGNTIVYLRPDLKSKNIDEITRVLKKHNAKTIRFVFSDLKKPYKKASNHR